MCKIQHVTFSTKVDQTAYRIACILKNEGKESSASIQQYSAGCNDDLYMLRSFATRSVSYGIFCEKIDSLFDIFNSTGLHDVKLYKRALQDNCPSFENVCITTDSFKRLKIQGSRGATPCITGWQLSISEAKIIQQRIFWEIRSHHPYCSICVVPKKCEDVLCPISWAQCICQRHIKEWSVSF